LDLIGDEEGAVFPAEFLGGGKVIVGWVLYPFALDGFKDESCDIAGAEFRLEVGEIAKFDETSPRQEGSKVLAKVAGVGDRERAEGEAMVGALLRQDFGAFGGGAGEFEGSLDRLRSGVTQEAGISREGPSFLTRASARSPERTEQSIWTILGRSSSRTSRIAF